MPVAFLLAELPFRSLRRTNRRTSLSSWPGHTSLYALDVLVSSFPRRIVTEPFIRKPFPQTCSEIGAHFCCRFDLFLRHSYSFHDRSRNPVTAADSFRLLACNYPHLIPPRKFAVWCRSEDHGLNPRWGLNPDSDTFP